LTCVIAAQLPDDAAPLPPKEFFTDDYHSAEEARTFHVGHELVDRVSKGTFCNMCDEVLPIMSSIKKYARRTLTAPPSIPASGQQHRH
jgi:hypothetical protein